MIQRAPYNLSDSIRIGSAVLPQHFGSHFEVNEHGEIVGACAMGTAIFAIGMQYSYLLYVYNGRRHLWPIASMEVECPECGFRNPLDCQTSHLQEQHGWPLSMISDYVASVEALFPELCISEEVEVPVN